MSETADLERADRIYSEVLREPADQRRAKLRELCGDDQVLREQVLRLLDAAAPSTDHSLAETIVRPEDASVAHVADEPPRDAQGRRFGSYELIREIARGGMGVVYEARQIGLNRRVALKMIRNSELASEEETQRFLNEAEAAASLDHPNIVPIYDVGQQDGQPFFSMGFVDGETLADRITQQPLTADDGARVVKTAADAVGYAHSRGIVHRDLKPSNILLAYEGSLDDGNRPAVSACVPKISDFGLAKRIQSDSSLTASGQVMGTPSYMPPEQASGATDQTGPLADVYSLGAVLYCALTGRPPFQAATQAATLQQVLEREPLPVRQVNPDVPRDLETICLKCLEKNPEKRFASAEDLADDLRRFLDREPIKARPIGRFEYFRRWCMRNWMIVLPSALAILMLIAGTVVSTALYARTAEALEGERTERQRANDNYQRAQEREFFALQQRYAAEAALAFEDADNRKMSRIRKFLDAHLKPDRPDRDLRSFEWYHLWHVCCGDLYVLQGRQTILNSIEYSPDGRLLAVGYAGGVQVRNTKERQWHEFLEHPGMTSLSISPDGSLLATGGGAKGAGTVKLWELASGKHVATLEGHSDGVHKVDFSSDGKWLASASADKTVKLWSVANRTLHSTWQHEHHCGALAFSPDASTLAIRAHDVVIRSIPDGKKLKTLEVGEEAHSVAFSPDGKYLAVGHHNGRVRLWDAGKWALLKTFTGHTKWVAAIGFSPDGKTLASGSEDRTLRLWKVPDGSTRGVLRGHRAGIWDLDFEPTGKAIVTASMDQTAKFWNVQPGLASEVTMDLPPALLSITDDGGVLAAGIERDTMHLLDLATSATVGVIRSNRTDWDGIVHSPKGDLTAARFKDGTLQVWRTSTGKVMRKWKSTRRVSRMALSPRGKTLALGCDDGTFELWNTATGQRDAELSPGDGKAVDVGFSPDGEWFATVGIDKNETTIRLWDTKTQQLRHQFRTRGTFRVAFTNDGKRLAAGDYAGKLSMWDVETGKLAAEFVGHTGFITSIAFSRDGKCVATGSMDRSLKLWNLATGHELTTFRHPGWVLAAAFSDDGLSLTTIAREKSRPRVMRRWRAASDRRIQARLQLEKEEGRPEYGEVMASY